MAVEIETILGPIIIATTYLPPRRNYVPVQDIKRLESIRKPVYLVGDLNPRHPFLGHRDRNIKGNYLHKSIQDGKLKYLGPDFPTLANGRGKPDIILGNRNAHMNILIKEGNLTTSDHIPIIMLLATKPIMIKTEPRPNYKKANWET